MIRILITPLVLSLIFTLLAVVAYIWLFRSYRTQRKLSQVKSDFINSMSHELRTPLATIDLCVDNLLAREKSRDMKDYFSIIKEENNRMQSYIANILQLAQFDKPEFELDLQLMYPDEMLRGIVERMQPYLNSKGAQIDLKSDASRVAILGDKVHLVNVLQNLIDNALVYNQNQPLLSIKTRLSGGVYVVELQDNGIGISARDQKYIFDKFYRVQRGNLYERKGTGIGLSYCKEIIERHKGTIAVSSRLAQGSTFVISIPAEKKGEGE